MWDCGFLVRNRSAAKYLLNDTPRESGGISWGYSASSFFVFSALPIPKVTLNLSRSLGVECFLRLTVTYRLYRRLSAHFVICRIDRRFNAANLLDILSDINDHNYYVIVCQFYKMLVDGWFLVLLI